MILSLSALPEIDRIVAALEHLSPLDHSGSDVRGHAKSIYIANLMASVRKWNPHRRKAGTKKAVKRLLDHMFSSSPARPCGGHFVAVRGTNVVPMTL